MEAHQYGEYKSPTILNFEIDDVNIDLDQMKEDLQGPALIIRLHFIALHCPSLRHECFKIAINEAKMKCNINAYKYLHKDLEKFDTLSMELDKDWIANTSAYTYQKLDQLETDLQNYRSNCFYDSVRRGCRNTALFLLDRGRYSEALKMFIKMRDFCTSSRHNLIMCMNVALSSIFIGDWLNASVYAHKARNEKEDSECEDLIIKITCCGALADLQLGKYKSAAKGFTKMNVDKFTFPSLMSPLNVCIYGGICALATYDRAELKHLFYNSQFRQFLELEPLMRESISHYLNSQYSEMLICLAKIKHMFLLDVFVNHHTNKLYSLVRKRAFIQFFLPYKSVSLTKMSNAFDENDHEKLEREVVELISLNKINARIDFQKKIIYTMDVDMRKQSFQNVINVCDEIEVRTKAMVLQKIIKDS